MKVEDAIKLLDQIWRQVPLIHEVNLKVQEAIKVLQDEFSKNKDKE